MTKLALKYPVDVPLQFATIRDDAFVNNMAVGSVADDVCKNIGKVAGVTVVGGKRTWRTNDAVI